LRRVIYSMGVSLDGFIAGPDGSIGLTVDEELHRFYNQQARETGLDVYGRRLYEVMTYWDTAAEKHPSSTEIELEFARIWKETPKLVFSRTLERVEMSNCRLAQDDVAEEIRRLKEQPGKDIHIGGADLAATFIRLDLIDEYRPVVHPIVLGGGTPYLPPLDERLNLQLLETRTFGSGAVYLRYERQPTPRSTT
jgi:dihydrofolate reductase